MGSSVEAEVPEVVSVVMVTVVVTLTVVPEDVENCVEVVTVGVSVTMVDKTVEVTKGDVVESPEVDVVVVEEKMLSPLQHSPPHADWHG